jgi:predicted nucleic acid-binding protein
MVNQRTAIFLDTAYVNALINTRDQWHERAIHWEQKLAAERRKLLTTEFILIEIGDSLATLNIVWKPSTQSVGSLPAHS